MSDGFAELYSGDYQKHNIPQEPIDVEGLQNQIDLKANKADVYLKTQTYSGTEIDSKIAAIPAPPAAISVIDNLTSTDAAAALSAKQGKALNDGKAASVHTHTKADITGLQTDLDNKAPLTHTHTIANVTGLQAALDAKQNTTAADTWHTMTPQNAWLNDTSNTAIYPALSYKKDAAGNVHVRGTVKSGATGTTIATLPAGYRPDYNVYNHGGVDSAFASVSIKIDATGAIQPNGTFSNTWLSFYVMFSQFQ